MTFMETAAKVITERREQYGSPKEHFERVAKRWSISLGTFVTPADVIQCMIDLKQERLRHDPTHMDSIIDIAGYAALLAEIWE